MEKTIYFAGGCFWGVEEFFRRTKGVVETRVGYANGNGKTSYYELYKTGHAEAVEIVFDDEIVPLEKLLRLYFTIIDPVSVNKQGNDIGAQYRTGIYYTNDTDIDTITTVAKEVQHSYKKPLAVEIAPLNNFVPAEDYHQHYLLKNPNGYCHIKLPKL